MTDENQLNADLSLPLAIDTDTMAWQASPAPGVDRKRLFRNGPQESGRVTSIVRYAPGSQFPSHPHPEGEEIYVLSGVFSDVRGDWPAGSYLLNPEGFEHSPGSAPGCVLFVRLRQAPGDRRQVGLRAEERVWTEEAGVDRCALWAQSGHEDQMCLERWHFIDALSARSLPHGAEYLLLEGTLHVGGEQFGEHSFFRVPPGETFEASGDGAVTLLVRLGGFDLMRPEVAA
jgi:anti-sigma factor ChrR (cupin superfamily)